MASAPCFYLQLSSQEWYSPQKAVSSHINSQWSKLPDRLAYRPVWLRFLIRGTFFPDDPSLIRQTTPFQEGGVTDWLEPLFLRKECTYLCSPSRKQAACNITEIFADRLCIRNFHAWLFQKINFNSFVEKKENWSSLFQKLKRFLLQTKWTYAFTWILGYGCPQERNWWRTLWHKTLTNFWRKKNQM